VKLAEYALALKAPLAQTGVITDLKDFTVRGPWIHVLTSQGNVYRFNTNNVHVTFGESAVRVWPT
jgi:hypothetical protein